MRIPSQYRDAFLSFYHIVCMLGAFFTGIIRRPMFFCTSIWVKMQTNLSGSWICRKIPGLRPPPLNRALKILLSSRKDDKPCSAHFVFCICISICHVAAVCHLATAVFEVRSADLIGWCWMLSGNSCFWRKRSADLIGWCRMLFGNISFWREKCRSDWFFFKISLHCHQRNISTSFVIRPHTNIRNKPEVEEE